MLQIVFLFVDNTQQKRTITELASPSQLASNAQ